MILSECSFSQFSIVFLLLSRFQALCKGRDFLFSNIGTPEDSHKFVFQTLVSRLTLQMGFDLATVLLTCGHPEPPECVPISKSLHSWRNAIESHRPTRTA